MRVSERAEEESDSEREDELEGLGSVTGFLERSQDGRERSSEGREAMLRGEESVRPFAKAGKALHWASRSRRPLRRSSDGLRQRWQVGQTLRELQRVQAKLAPRFQVAMLVPWTDCPLPDPLPLGEREDENEDENENSFGELIRLCV